MSERVYYCPWCGEHKSQETSTCADCGAPMEVA